MTRAEEYELALASRDSAIAAERRKSEDEEHYLRLVEIFDTKGSAYVSKYFDKVVEWFPPNFVHKHVRMTNFGTKWQRASLRNVDRVEGCR